MKVVLLAAGGRAGSDFFHSLIDGHPEILQFPGYLRVNKLKPILNYDTHIKIAKTFIKSFPEFFDSRNEKFERWDKLGQGKNKHFKINKKKFISSFIKISKKKNSFNKLEIIKNLHFSYFKAKGDKKEKKILFIHTHLLSWTKLFIKITGLKEFEILHTIRHPLAAINSNLRTWLTFQNGAHYFPKDLYYHLDKICNCINDLIKLNKKKKVHIVQLEKLHLENKKFMIDFCKKFKIKYEYCLCKSTKNGLKWWGDMGTKKWISGINKNFKIKIDEKYFYKRDLIFFQNLTIDIAKKYNYQLMYPKKNIYFNFLPMKCEIMIWRNTIKHLFYKGFRWKHLLSIPFFYFKRNLLLNKILINNRYKILPSSIG